MGSPEGYDEQAVSDGTGGLATSNGSPQQQNIPNATNFWEVVGASGDIPPPRALADAAVVDGKVFLFGGCSIDATGQNGKAVGDLHVYDPDFRMWKLIPTDPKASPCPRHSHTLLAHGRRLVLFGGCADSSVALNDLWMFDVDSFRWNKIRQPATHQGHDVKRGLSIVGTQGAAAAAPTTEWPRPRYLHSAVIHSEGMYVYGGWMSDWSKGDRLWRLEFATLTWEGIDSSKNAPTPDRRFGHKTAVWEDCMYVFGGSKSTGTTNEIWAFNFSVKRWSLLNPTGAIPPPRKWHAAVRLEGRWLIQGGVTTEANGPHSTNIPLRDAYEFSFQRLEWTRCSALEAVTDSAPCESHCAVLVPSHLVLCAFFMCGRTTRKTPVSEVYRVEIFRPDSHEQVEDNDRQMAEVRGALQDQINRALRPPLEDLVLAAMPLRISFESVVVASLDKQLRKVTAKVIECVQNDEETNVVDVPDIGEVVTQLREHFRNLEDATVKCLELSGSKPPQEGEMERQLMECLVGALSEASGVNADDVRGWTEGDQLDPEHMAALEALASPLNFLRQQQSELWDKFIAQGVATLDHPEESPVNVLLLELNGRLQEVEGELRESSRLVQDPGLSVKERKAVGVERNSLTKHLLSLMSEKLDTIARKLREEPIAVDVSVQNFKDTATAISERAHTLATEQKKALAKHEKYLAYLEKFQKEKNSTFDEAVLEFEQKKSQFVERRAKLMEDLQAAVSKIMAEYEAIMEEERKELLQMELKRREGAEAERRVLRLREDIHRPMDRSNAQLCGYSKVAPTVLTELMEKEQALLESIQRAVGQDASKLATEAVQDACRFPALAEAALDGLRKELVSREQAMIVMEERLKTKSDKLSMLEVGADAAAAALDDEHPDRRSSVTTPMEEYGIPEAERTGCEYQNTLNQVEQLKQVMAALENDLESSRREVVEVEELIVNYNTKLEKLKGMTAEEVSEESSMRRLLDSGFSWQTVEAECALPQKAVEEWMSSFYHVDSKRMELSAKFSAAVEKAKAQGAVEGTEIISRSAALGLKAAPKASTARRTAGRGLNGSLHGGANFAASRTTSSNNGTTTANSRTPTTSRRASPKLATSSVRTPVKDAPPTGRSLKGRELSIQGRPVPSFAASKSSTAETPMKSPRNNAFTTDTASSRSKRSMPSPRPLQRPVAGRTPSRPPPVA